MATAVDRPELDEQLDWGVGWEEDEAAAARRPAQPRQGARAGLRESGALVAFEDWRDSRRMRRNLRRGAAAAAAGGATAGGLRELVYRVDDSRTDRKAIRYNTRARSSNPRRGPVLALLLVAVAVAAMFAALAIGSGSSSHKTVATAAPPVRVPDNTPGMAPGASLAASHRQQALHGARVRKLAALRKARAAALHRERVAALKPRRRAAAAARHHAAPAPVAA